MLNANCRAFKLGDNALIARIKKQYLAQKSAAPSRTQPIHIADYNLDVHVTESPQQASSVLQYFAVGLPEGTIPLILGGDGTVRDALNAVHHHGGNFERRPWAYQAVGNINVMARDLGMKLKIEDYLAALTSAPLVSMVCENVPTCKITGYTSQGADIVSYGHMFGIGIVPHFLEEYYKDKYNVARSIFRIMGISLAGYAFSWLYKSPTYRKLFDPIRVSLNGKEQELTFLMFQTLRYFGFWNIFHLMSREARNGQMLAINAGPGRLVFQFGLQMIAHRQLRGSGSFNWAGQKLEIDFGGDYQTYMINGDNSQWDYATQAVRPFKAKRISIEVSHSLPIFTGARRE